MSLELFYIQKNDEFEAQSQKYAKLISAFTKFKEKNLLNKKILAAQNSNQNEAQRSYEEALSSHKKGFCVVLSERGEEKSSHEFAKMIENKNELKFFIGGAFGLSENFEKSFDFSLCLSKFTLTHSFARLLLLEQIYRAFCIIKNHPYHK